MTPGEMKPGSRFAILGAITGEGHRGPLGSEGEFSGCPPPQDRYRERVEVQVPDPVNLAELLAGIDDLWNPVVVAELNGQHVKVAKVKGEFVWHHHENEDELFLVLKGVLDLELRDRTVSLGPGEIFVVPRGTDHRPVAKEEVHLLMFEPESTLNTGNVRDHRTIDRPRRI